MDQGPGFIHLRVRSAYSLLEGALRFSKLVELAGEHSMPAIGLTDTNNLFGALEYSEVMAGAGIQPIVGCTLAVAFGDGEVANRRGGEPVRLPSLALLAKDDVGYANLMRLSSAAFLDVEGTAPVHVPIELIAEHGEGLIALTGGLDGPVADALANRRDDLARARLSHLRGVFGDRLYVELQRHGLAKWAEVEAPLVELAYELDLPLVATNDVHFVGPDDYSSHDALICIAEGEVVANDNRRRLTPEHWFKPGADMLALFADLPEATANTIEIARRCAVRPMRRQPILPNFGAVGGGLDEAAELRRQAEEGLELKLKTHGPTAGHTAEDYRERLAHELDIIISMEFPGYFLIVADIIKWSKNNGIPVGPGRGSGAASVVAWVLTITDLDPLRFKLVFERFLNPHRVSMPDFDIDFCPDRRDEVIGYIRDTYGHDRVAQIITFGKLQARAVLRDVGRVLQMPYGQIDRLCKLVPNNPADPVTLAQAVAGEPKLQEARDEDETVARLLEIGGALEGLYRHASTHAAGVVIGDRPLVELVPLYRDPRSEMLVTQFNMKWVEQAGLVKFDILGLKTLTVLQAAERLVRDSGGEIDLARLPLDNPPTYELLARGDTLGVFQFESAGMRDLLVKAEPTNFEDLIALVALFRPGPMENIPKYLAYKHGLEQPEPLHELIEPVVADTYGVIIYQEQVLQIAQHLAGFSLGEADLLRRAMGKKIKSEMDAQRARFIDGAVERGVDRSRAKHIFDLVDKFAGYGFNKAHSAAYALIAYQTAYLKANHPVEFLAASMTLDMGNTDKLALFREEAERMGFRVLPPSINASEADFAVEDGGIRYALAALRNVGRQAVEQIVEHRRENGPFRSLGDFAARTNAQLVNRRTLESLVRAGAFDGFEPERAAVFAGIDHILLEAQRAMSDRRSGQNDLFGADGVPRVPTIELPAAEPWDPIRRLNEEFEAVGSYLSGHPLDGYQQSLANAEVTPWRTFESLALEHGHRAGRLAGTVTSRRERRSRNGNRFAFVGFSDATGQFEAIVFSDVLAESGEALEVGVAVILRVEADVEGDRVRLRVVSASKIDASLAPDAAEIRVFVRDEGPLDAVACRLNEAGEDSVSIVLIDGERGREVELRLAQGYRVGERVAGSIKAIPGVVAVERTPIAATEETVAPRLSNLG